MYDGDVLAANYRALRERLHPALGIFYSLKANPNVSVCGLLHALGANAEVSSLAELRTALAAGVAPQDVLFLGPGKSRDELVSCLNSGVRAIIVESLPSSRSWTSSRRRWDGPRASCCASTRRSP